MTQENSSVFLNEEIFLAPICIYVSQNESGNLHQSEFKEQISCCDLPTSANSKKASKAQV